MGRKREWLRGERNGQKLGGGRRSVCPAAMLLCNQSEKDFLFMSVFKK